MSQSTLERILNHPDKEELLSKISSNMPEKDIHDTLFARYSNPKEKKFVIPIKTIKEFKNVYLDTYKFIANDIQNTKLAVSNGTVEELELSLQNNPTYKSKMMELASSEIDVKKSLAKLAAAIEIRLGTLYDMVMEDPTNVNIRLDGILIRYVEVFAPMLKSIYDMTEGANTTANVTNNINIQFLDKHVDIFKQAIMETLQEMDIEYSLIFLDKFNQKLSALKPVDFEKQMNTDQKVAEVKILNDQITQRLS